MSENNTPAAAGERSLPHTPGPWIAHTNDFGLSASGPYVPVADDWGRAICAVYSRDMGSKELPYEANARLIAAAPEMLDALKEVERILQAPPSQREFVLNTTMSMVSAAIRKATEANLLPEDPHPYWCTGPVGCPYHPKCGCGQEA